LKKREPSKAHQNTKELQRRGGGTSSTMSMRAARKFRGELRENAREVTMATKLARHQRKKIALRSEAIASRFIEET